MRDVHELKIERTDLQLVTTLDLNQSRIDAMLLALGFNESNVSLEPISGMSGRSSADTARRRYDPRGRG